jgi:ATP-binding cassette subfamily B protein
MFAKLHNRIRPYQRLFELYGEVHRIHPLYIVVAALFRAVNAVLPLITLAVAKMIIDMVSRPSHEHSPAAGRHILLLALLEGVLVISSTLLSMLMGYLDTRMTNAVTTVLSLRLLEHTANLDLATVEDSGFQDRLARAHDQISSAMATLTQLLLLGEQMLRVTVAITILLLKSPWLGLQCVAVFPLLYLELRSSSRQYGLYKKLTRERREEKYLHELCSASSYAKESRAFGSYELVKKWLSDTLARKNNEEEHEEARYLKEKGLFELLLSSCFYAAYARLAWLGYHGTITTGDLVLMVGLMQTSRSQVQSILQGSASSLSRIVRVNDLYEIFDVKPTISKSEKNRDWPDKMVNGIEFKDVSFSYPGCTNSTLANVYFRIQPGECVALFGLNGSGKSTITKLLNRLYDPTEGSILLNGCELREYDLQTLRKRVSLVFQDYVRYDRSVYTNVALGAPHLFHDHARVVRSVEKAGASCLIAGFKGGYEQMLGRRFDDGVDLSGGQWQRLAIARGCMTDADLYIFDEPTSSIDAAAEHELMERLATMIQGRMSLIISHRFSTLRRADRVLVLEGGRIIQQGSHEQLLREGGAYAKLFNLQASSYT